MIHANAPYGDPEGSRLFYRINRAASAAGAVTRIPGISPAAAGGPRPHGSSDPSIRCVNKPLRRTNPAGGRMKTTKRKPCRLSSTGFFFWLKIDILTESGLSLEFVTQNHLCTSFFSVRNIDDSMNRDNNNVPRRCGSKAFGFMNVHCHTSF